MKKYIVWLLVLMVFPSYGQELYPLGYRPVEVPVNFKKSATSDTLSLPFFDDFSRNRLAGYADAPLWSDNFVHINNTFPSKQPTVGVATFDGLDQTGYPYDFTAVNTHGKADYLTSQPIDLNYVPGDSIYLSFFAQSGTVITSYGARNIDSLLVEFKNMETEEWEVVWRKPGAGRFVPEDNFTQYLIPIKEDKYLHKGFQFRFLNYSNLSSAAYLWHVDYVKLDINRNKSDVDVSDVGYRYAKNNVLSEYSIMPWEMYQRQGASAADLNLSASVYNNANFNKVGDYAGIVVKENGNVVKTESFGATIQYNANSEFTYNYSLDNPIINPNWVGNGHETKFEINYVLNTNTPPEYAIVNDTLTFIQSFRPQLAYDDGSAEFGFGVNVNGGKIAYQFQLDQPDSIRSVWIYFNPIQIDYSGDNFLVTVWSSLSPENILHRNESFSFPDYTKGVNGFVEYALDEPVAVDGVFYIGYTQTKSGRMNVGLDYNTNAKAKIFYNEGAGFQNTEVIGALLIRPNFGGVGTSLAETEVVKLPNLVLTNPVVDMLQINPEIQVTKLELYDMFGKVVAANNQPRLQVDNLPTGTYIIKVITSSNQLLTQKIMIQR